MNNTDFKINKVTLSSVIVGIDVAKYNHKARIFTDRGIELTKKAISFSNTAEGFEQLINNINKICLKNFKDHVLIGVEPTGHYWFNILHYVDNLQSAINFEIVTVNPAHTKKANELDDNSQTKNDMKDAKTIALLVRDGRYSIPNIPKGAYANLRNYISYRDRLLRSSSSIINRLHRGIDILFPEYQKAFKDIDAKTSLQTLINFPNPKTISELSTEDIVKKWREVVKSGIGIKKASQLKTLAKCSVGVKEGNNSLVFEIKSLAKQLILLKQQEEELNTLIGEEITKISYSKLFLEIDGLALKSVSGIIAEIGDLRLYKNGKQLQKLAGYNLKENSSGEHKGKTTITKRGRRRLRRVLFNAVMPLIVQNEAFKALYNYYRYRKDNPLKYKQAIVALSCKLLRILHGISKTNKSFNCSEVLKGINKNQSTAKAA